MVNPTNWGYTPNYYTDPVTGEQVWTGRNYTSWMDVPESIVSNDGAYWDNESGTLVGGASYANPLYQQLTGLPWLDNLIRTQGGVTAPTTGQDINGAMRVRGADGKEYYAFEAGINPYQFRVTNNGRIQSGSSQGDSTYFDSPISGFTNINGQDYILTAPNDGLPGYKTEAPLPDDAMNPLRATFDPTVEGSLANFALKAAGAYGTASGLGSVFGEGLSTMVGGVDAAGNYMPPDIGGGLSQIGNNIASIPGNLLDKVASIPDMVSNLPSEASNLWDSIANGANEAGWTTNPQEYVRSIANAQNNLPLWDSDYSWADLAPQGQIIGYEGGMPIYAPEPTAVVGWDDSSGMPIYGPNPAYEQYLNQYQYTAQSGPQLPGGVSTTVTPVNDGADGLRLPSPSDNLTAAQINDGSLGDGLPASSPVNTFTSYLQNAINNPGDLLTKAATKAATTAAIQGLTTGEIDPQKALLSGAIGGGLGALGGATGAAFSDLGLPAANTLGNAAVALAAGANPENLALGALTNAAGGVANNALQEIGLPSWAAAPVTAATLAELTGRDPMMSAGMTLGNNLLNSTGTPQIESSAEVAGPNEQFAGTSNTNMDGFMSPAPSWLNGDLQNTDMTGFMQPDWLNAQPQMTLIDTPSATNYLDTGSIAPSSWEQQITTSGQEPQGGNVNETDMSGFMTNEALPSWLTGDTPATESLIQTPMADNYLNFGTTYNPSNNLIDGLQNIIGGASNNNSTLSGILSNLPGSIGTAITGALKGLTQPNSQGSGLNGLLLPLLGGILGSMSGQKQSGTTTVVNDVPEWLKPNITNLLTRAQNQFNTVTSDPNRNSLLAPATQTMNDTITGKYLDPSTNPWLKSTYEQAARSVSDAYNTTTQPRTDALFNKSGAFGPQNSAYAEQVARNHFGLGQNLSDLATNIYGGNYQQERKNQLAATTAAPDFTTASSNSTFAPYQNYANTLKGWGSQQTTPYYTNPYANALGGAMAGYGATKLFG